MATNSKKEPAKGTPETTARRPAKSAKPVPASSSTPVTVAHEQIRRRAYELYEKRGRRDGFAEQDWLQAEAELATRSA